MSRLESIKNNLREFQLFNVFFSVISLDCQIHTSLWYYLITYLAWRAVQRIEIWNRKQCSSKFKHTAIAIRFILLSLSIAELHKLLLLCFLFSVRSLITMYHENNLTSGILNEPWWSGIMHLCSLLRFSYKYWWIKNHESHCVYKCLAYINSR